MAIRILIVDDHPIVREGLIGLLKGAPDCKVIAEASEADEALAKARKEKPDMILLDIALPGKSGFELLKQLHIEMPKIKVVVLSMYSETQYAIRCLKAGAKAYLTKRSAPKELLNAITKVIAGGKYISAALSELLAREIGFDATSEPHERLSDREFQVLCFLGQGMTVTQISKALSISASTVNKYRSQILYKMNLHTTAQLIRYALDNNLTYPSE
ncbi:MAG TPA: response regulator transcription factor [Bacteroidota bacterium]|nr:response regulator transcription factor [Bacteroidota bacterium]